MVTHAVMSQKPQSDGAQKHFPVGLGLMAAAETLNFTMTEQRSARQMGVGGGDGQDGGGQMSRRGGGGGNNLGSTMKLFASLGLSPSDLDALAEIPEEDISVETLPRILMQLKNRKGDGGERRPAPSEYRGGGGGGRDSWDGGHVSLGQSAASDFGFGSMQNAASSRGYGLNYGGGGGSGGGGSRDRPYSQLSYGGRGLGPAAAAAEPVFMQRRMGSPSNGKVQDFHGVMPPMFPHVCSLCDFDVHSTMVSTAPPPPPLSLSLSRSCSVFCPRQWQVRGQRSLGSRPAGERSHVFNSMNCVFMSSPGPSLHILLLLYYSVTDSAPAPGSRKSQ